jgi:thiamine-monophosphate kinase
VADAGSLGDLGEFPLIDRLIAASAAPDGRVVLGPGDDTAIVAVPTGRVLMTTDMLIEGRHFRRDWSTAVDVGRRAAAASLADIAAMGGAATALVVAFAAPPDLPAAWAVQCAAGLAEEAAKVGAHVVGGDVSASDAVVIAVTAIGETDGVEPVRRSGAREGDVLAVAGRLGWAAAGLAVLSRGFKSPRALVDAHRFPEPPYAQGPLAARAGATSMIDVSDGLVADAGHLAQASQVLIAIDSHALEVADPIAALAAAYNVSPLEWMLTGGDDHALLATFPEGAVLPDGYLAIGRVEGGSPGVLVDGRAYTGSTGHEHFR